MTQSLMVEQVHLRNFKGITDGFELGPRTLIIGPNGSGKSAILEAIYWTLQLGLDGFRSDSSADLLDLALGGVGPMFASTHFGLLGEVNEERTVIESDVLRLSAEAEGSTAKGSRPTYVGEPPPVWLAAPHVEALLATKKSADLRKAFLAMSSRQIDPKRLKASMTKAGAAMFSELAKRTPPGTSGVAKLVAIKELLARVSREATAELRQAEKDHEAAMTAARLLEDEDLASDVERYDELKDRRLALQDEIDKARRRINRGDVPSEERIAELEAGVEALRREAPPASTERINDVLRQWRRLLQTRKAALSALLETVPGQERGCPCCGAGGDDVEARMRNLISAAEKRIVDGEQALKVRGDLERAERALRTAKSARAAALDEDTEDGADGLEELRGELRELGERLDAAQSVRGAPSQEAADKALREARERRQTLDRLSPIIDQAIFEESQAAAADLMERAGRALDRGTSPEIVLWEGAKPVFKAALRRKEWPHPRAVRALSKGQRMELAVGLGYLGAAGRDEPFRLAAFDEQGLSSASLDVVRMRAVVEALGRVPVGEGSFSQIIMTTTAWAGDVPEGWTAIKLRGRP